MNIEEINMEKEVFIVLMPNTEFDDQILVAGGCTNEINAELAISELKEKFPGGEFHVAQNHNKARDLGETRKAELKATGFRVQTASLFVGGAGARELSHEVVVWRIYYTLP